MLPGLFLRETTMLLAQTFFILSIALWLCCILASFATVPLILRSLRNGKAKPMDQG